MLLTGQAEVPAWVRFAISIAEASDGVASDAAQVPGGCDELVEQSLLERALGSDVVLEFGEEGFEFFAIFKTDDEILGGESMLPGVLGGAGFAVIGSRAGAELRVDDVGGSAGGTSRAPRPEPSL